MRLATETFSLHSTLLFCVLNLRSPDCSRYSLTSTKRPVKVPSQHESGSARSESRICGEKVLNARYLAFEQQLAQHSAAVPASPVLHHFPGSVPISAAFFFLFGKAREGGEHKKGSCKGKASRVGTLIRQKQESKRGHREREIHTKKREGKRKGEGEKIKDRKGKKRIPPVKVIYIRRNTLVAPATKNGERGKGGKRATGDWRLARASTPLGLFREQGC